ncbi:MAG: histidine kinase [Gammaproteobacteria bacterium]|nr:histidine kinase [Gammaproteobacteria bacterium]
MTLDRDTKSNRSLRLPDFGSTVITYRMLIVAFSIGVILTIARHPQFNHTAWNDFLLITSFALMIAISSILVLKFIAKPVRKLNVVSGGISVFLALLAASALVCEGLILLLHELHLTAERWPEWHHSLLLRTLIITAIIGALALRYIFVYHQAELEQEAQQQERLQALQSRIRPHFLYNSMNSVASLIRAEPELAEKALQDLADVFRVLLADARKMVPISVEGELSRQYLDIEKLRLGDRLHVKWTASNVPRSAQIPSLTLQPLIENAVYHGIEPNFTGGTVEIELWSEQDTLNIMITNPVPEVTNRAQHRRGNRIALNNVSERLSRHFGGKAVLQNFEQLGKYHVKLRMPIVRG